MVMTYWSPWCLTILAATLLHWWRNKVQFRSKECLSKSVMKNPEEARSCCNSQRAWLLFPLLTEQEEGSYGSYPIEEHQLCTAYNIRVRCACNRGLTSDWSAILTIQDNQKREHSLCCEPGIIMTFLWTDFFFFLTVYSFTVCQKLGLMAIFFFITFKKKTHPVKLV